MQKGIFFHQISSDLQHVAWFTSWDYLDHFHLVNPHFSKDQKWFVAAWSLLQSVTHSSVNFVLECFEPV